MKSIATVFASLASVAIVSSVVFAHGGNEHIRGTVTQISAQAMTVETTAKKTATLTLTDKTAFERGGKHAALADLKVGDRVVVDVPEHTTQAILVQIGTAPAPKATVVQKKPAPAS